MAKLWQKDEIGNNELNHIVEKFTVGNDRTTDLLLAKYDVLGSIAHVKMLSHVKLFSAEESEMIVKELIHIFNEIEKGNFSISENTEDVHSEIEFRLTEKLGETGKKIHSGRSRNDQVLLDLKLFTRNEIEQLINKTKSLFDILIRLSEEHKEKLLPGYTHLQIAMPASFGLWFASYAESLTDDLQLLHAAFILANKNPLGSAAGYGTSLPLDRKLTTKLLGFDDLNYNVVYAQMNRGKMERTTAFALASVAATLSKLAMDCCLYMNQNFAFISFPDSLTTGSSIMPHKKNPDIWELIRAKCNKLQNMPAQINAVLTNLPSGYHRDLQIIKEDYLSGFSELNSCIEMAQLMLQHIKVRKNILEDEKYKLLFTVETVNQYVKEGMAFRDAYIKVGKEVETGSFKKPAILSHTHEGSIGNLCNDEIKAQMDSIIAQFPFDKINKALKDLTA